jgi:hypothetical protein
MAEVTVIHSVVTKATGSTAMGKDGEAMTGRNERRKLRLPEQGADSNHGPGKSKLRVESGVVYRPADDVDKFATATEGGEAAFLNRISA